MIISIPYKHTSGIELMYALRSIDKYFPDHDVIIVGDSPPEWYIGKHKYMHRDSRKEIDVCVKMNAVTPCIIWHDDHYMLTSTIEPWYDGTLELLLKRSRGVYAQKVKNTIALGCTLNYDVHAPFYFNGMAVPDREVCLKSVYMREQIGIPMSDCKVNGPLSYEDILKRITHKPFFSTGPNGITPAMLRVLGELFGEKSKYEKQ